ncbi:MAG: hypothetical protein D6741_12905, partial [Planctomycetota bacterium]
MKTIAVGLRMIAASAMIVSALGNVPVAASETEPSQAAPTVWLVDSRWDGCDTQEPAVYRARRGECLEPVTTEESYRALGDGRPIVVFIHGNLMDRADALRAAWTLRDAVLDDDDGATLDPEPHFVAWCWPAGKVRCR